MQIRSWAAAQTVLAVIGGCAKSTSKPDAEAAMAVVHQRLNAGDQDSIWNED